MSNDKPSDAIMLLTATGAAKKCSMSVRTWWRKDAAGHVPAAVTIGASTSKRWRSKELDLWCEAGCPPRKEWEFRKAENNKGNTKSG